MSTITNFQKNGLRLVKQRQIDSLLHKYEGKFHAEQIKHENRLLYHAQVAALERAIRKEMLYTNQEERTIEREKTTQRLNGIYDNFIKALDEKTAKRVEKETIVKETIVKETIEKETIVDEGLD
tara:strand:+ start:310 stop:681 length:372 start_codon:yes stop_codon:yes gene_type:complete